MKKIIIIAVTLVLLIGLVIFGSLYIAAYVAIADIERQANGPVTKETKPIPEKIISAENYKKLCHVNKAEAPEYYFLDGGITFPLIYPYENGYMMHYIYDYKVVDAKKNELLQTSKGSVMTLEIDYVDGEWIVCDVGEEFEYEKLMREKLFGTSAERPAA